MQNGKMELKMEYLKSHQDLPEANVLKTGQW